MGSTIKWVRRIAKVQAEKSGVIGLSRLLMEKLKQNVFVTDQRGRVLCWHATPENPIPPEEKVFLPGTVQKAEDMVKGIITIGGQKLSFRCWPIVHRETSGYLWVILQIGGLTPEETESIEILRAAMMVEFANKQEDRSLRQHLRDELIQNIIFNNSDKTDTAGQFWGWNLEQDHVVMVFDRSENPMGKGIREIRPQMEDYLVSKYPNIATGMIGNAFVALFPMKGHQPDKKGGGAGSWKRVPMDAFHLLSKEFPEEELQAGVGKVHWNEASLYRSFQEAKVALLLGKYAGKNERIAFFDDLGAIRLFYNQPEQDLKDFFHEVLGAVRDYDLQNEGNLLETLWAYFTEARKVAETAARLYIHVNTLRYRLRKVEELIGASLDDREAQFNVYSALKVGLMIGIIQL